MQESREALEARIEARLAERFPEVELIDLEVRGRPAGTLTLFIDRPGGVDLELCAAVSRALDDIREQYTLEVSSPGLNRRLRKPAHFAAVLGEEVAVKLTAPKGGRGNVRGELVASDEERITLRTEDGEMVSLPISGIARAHVVYKFDANGGQRE
jgi:ribosome maturation factor RimP